MQTLPRVHSSTTTPYTLHPAMITKIYLNLLVQPNYTLLLPHEGAKCIPAVGDQKKVRLGMFKVPTRCTALQGSLALVEIPYPLQQRARKA